MPQARIVFSCSACQRGEKSFSYFARRRCDFFFCYSARQQSVSRSKGVPGIHHYSSSCLQPLSNEAHARVKVNFGVCCKSTGVGSAKLSSVRETTSECQWWRRGKGSVGPLSFASSKDRAQSNGAEAREIRWHRRDFGAGRSGWRRGTMSARRRKNSF